MSIKNLRYWVFTSGENGIHGLDWGIKHASEYFSDRQKLDTDYRALLKDFGLPPSLERPENEAGLILLSWNQSDYIAGFIFSGMDHGDRPNTSSVICVIPSELVGIKSINEILNSIWSNNDIAEIASKNSQHRPDTLRLEGDSLVAENAPYFRNSVSWPGINNGWLQIDGRQRELSRVNAVKAPVTQMEIKPSSRGKLKIVVALVVVAMTFSTVKYFVSWNSENKVEILRPGDNTRVSNDVAVSQDKLGSPTLLGTLEDTSTKNIVEAEIIELREKLTKFLADIKGKPIKDGKNIIFRIGQWDEEKERLFAEIKSKINKISLKPKQPKHNDINIEVTFSFSAPVSEDIDNIGKVINAILSQH